MDRFSLLVSSRQKKKKKSGLAQLSRVPWDSCVHMVSINTEPSIPSFYCTNHKQWSVLVLTLHQEVWPSGKNRGKEEETYSWHPNCVFLILSVFVCARACVPVCAREHACVCVCVSETEGDWTEREGGMSNTSNIPLPLLAPPAALYIVFSSFFFVAYLDRSHL